jgi:hypothetical protein
VISLNRPMATAIRPLGRDAAISFLMRSTAVFAANSKFGSLAGSPKMRGVDHIRAMKLEPDRAGTGVSGQR